MNKELKIRETEDQMVYFTSDSHLGHHRGKAIEFVVQKRGFENVIDMDNAIIKSYNDTVRPNDILFHLGDFCLNTEESGLNEYLARIQCQNVYHIWGNHNNPLWLVYRKEINNMLSQYEARDGFMLPDDIEIYPFKYRNITFLGNYLEAQINGIKFVMAHYPIYVFNEMKHGVKHLCGHSHGSLPLSRPEDPQSKILDVGWDIHKKPLSVDEVCSIMKNKDNLKVDHHAKD
jgi:calcineurin-like phosphoesterase family protein